MFVALVFSLVLLVPKSDAFISRAKIKEHIQKLRENARHLRTEMDKNLNLPKDLTPGFFWQRYVTFVNTYHDSRKQHLSFLDRIQDAGLETVRGLMKSDNPLPGLDDDQGKKYLCTNYGLVSDLKTIKKVKPNLYKWYDDGSVDVTLFYGFGRFQTFFGTFYTQVMEPVLKLGPIMTVKGSAIIGFKTAQLSIKLHLPHWKEALKALRSKNDKEGCVVQVKSFQWDELDKLRLKMYNDAALVPNGDLLGKVLNRLEDEKDHIKEQMLKNVLVDLYNQLPDKPVCKHSEFVELATKWKVNKPRQYSSLWQDNCTDLWVPKKAPQDFTKWTLDRRVAWLREETEKQGDPWY